MKEPVGLVTTVLRVLWLAVLQVPVAAQDVAPLNRDNPWRVLAKLPVSDAVDGGHEVRVQDAEGKPVQADVFVYSLVLPTTAGGIARLSLSSIGAHGPALEAVTGAVRYHTNKDGVVHVALPANAYCLAIGDGVISERIKIQQATVAVVHPSGSILIEVVDAHGMPVANLPLRVRHPTRHRSIASCYTDRFGRCEFRILKQYTTEAARPIQIIAGVVAENPVQIPVPYGYFNSPARMMQMQLPAVGSVYVKVDAGERDRDHRDPITLQWNIPVGRYALPEPWPAIQSFGEGVLFPFVEVGTSVLARVSGTPGVHSASSAGPRIEHERVQLVISAVQKFLTIRGRLLDSAGQPIANTDCQGWICWRGEFRELRVRTGEDGRFEQKLESNWYSTGHAQVQLAPPQRGGAPARPACAVRIVPDVEHGTLRLGDMTVEPLPPLVHGTVVNEAGQPVAAVEVIANTGWGRRGRLRAITAADGSFAMFGVMNPAAKLDVQVRPPLWIGGINATGQAAVQVKVQAICGVSGQFEDPELAAVLTCRLVDANGRFLPAGSEPGKLNFSRVSPGKYSLHVSLAGRAVVRVHDIDVAHVERNEPEGLRKVRWLHAVKVATLRVQTADGSPARVRGTVYDGGRQSVSVVASEGGQLRLPFFDEQRIRLSHPMFRTLQIAPTTEPAVVVVQPRARLRVSLPEGMRLPVDARLVFGDDEDVCLVQRGGATMIRPDGSGDVFVDLMMRDPRGRLRNLHSQRVRLPEDDRVLDVALSITKKVVIEAKKIAEQVRATGR